MPRKLCLLLILLFMPFGLVWGCVAEAMLEPDYTVEGVARSPSGELLYTENLRYVVDSSGGVLLVEYRDAAGNLLANKTVEYNCQLTTPSFILTLADDQVAESVRWGDDEIVSLGDGEEKKLSKPRGAAIVDAGFDFAIRQSWDKLLSGEKVVYRYLFAKKGRFLKLQFRQTKPPVSEMIADNGELRFFRVAANNLLFRMLSSPIIVGYDQGNKDLRYYIGPSNLPMFDNGENVLISYSEHQSG